MQYLARPYHIQCHVRQVIRYTMPYLSRLYHIPCHISRHAITYATPCPAGHIIYNATSRMPYHIPCHAHKPIHYIVPYITRPHDILCHIRQAIPYTMLCPADHRIYHVMPARPYHIPCRVGSRLSITSLKADTVRVQRVSLPGYVNSQERW